MTKLFCSWLNCRHLKASHTVDYDLKLRSEQVAWGYVFSLQHQGALEKTFSSDVTLYTALLFLIRYIGAGNRLYFDFIQAYFFPSGLCLSNTLDRLCGLVLRVSGYISRGPGFDSRHYQILWEVVGLEGGPLSLMRIIEELLERKVAAPV
jgi:hypothetical protein